MRAVVLFFLRLLAQASADDTTCVSPCAMTTEAAQAALERQRARSAQLVAEIRPQRMRDAREKARAQEKANRGVKGEFNDNFVASKVLGWAVTAPGSSACWSWPTSPPTRTPVQSERHRRAHPLGQSEASVRVETHRSPLLDQSEGRIQSSHWDHF